MRWHGLLLALAVTSSCRQLLDIDDPYVPAPADASRDVSIDTRIDAPPDGPPMTLTFDVGCGMATTANALCQDRGFARAGAVRGHGWWQCGGTGDRCPGGFVGLGCPTWCGASDCVNDPFCGISHSVVQIDGTGTTVWNPLDYPGGNCLSGAPGWTVRAICIP